MTCVHQPRHSGLSGVKRRYPLMLNENPSKKNKSNTPSNSEGPTIHELDNADVLPDDLFVEENDSLGQVCEIYLLPQDNIGVLYF